ncbi:TetR/AcrR family transcriptional regulator [Sporolactobacillus kofuensis]|uniref:TetR/AcrR family transcriptional regulator n=1 Tax=Sporolactobacillus kofuensis TaxID=269672 RepID=A0ABW1WGI9_9BACL|nr:TetR/AcrR family transcriptional regulator [Sporolactobacillus kofuensis]MCO7175442.1 TetR/AcrR family transcriptional regulator [Sporolactobacillus kofuensis]
MEESKEHAILIAAIHEFAVKGYAQASTNQIAQSAGASKGLIFHYYGYKEKLFEESVNYALDFSMKALDFKKWDLSDDLMEKLKGYCEQELLFCKNYPDFYQLIVQAFTRPPKQLTDKMGRLFKDLQLMVPQFINQMINALDLKDDVDTKTLQHVLFSHYQYYSSQAMDHLKKHPETTIDELRPFINQYLAMNAMSLRGLQKHDK